MRSQSTEGQFTKRFHAPAFALIPIEELVARWGLSAELGGGSLGMLIGPGILAWQPPIRPRADSVAVDPRDFELPFDHPAILFWQREVVGIVSRPYGFDEQKHWPGIHQLNEAFGLACEAKYDVTWYPGRTTMLVFTRRGEDLYEWQKLSKAEGFARLADGADKLVAMFRAREEIAGAVDTAQSTSEGDTPESWYWRDVGKAAAIRARRLRGRANNLGAAP